jgi:tetratricopeptide (TPR) repeat protein
LPYLTSERGAALLALKQWPDALANYEKGLGISPLPDSARALLLRGRGFSLTELGRLDDAEKSYRDSLIAEPNNARALAELNYIARIRAGGAPTASGLLTVKPQPNP